MVWAELLRLNSYNIKIALAISLLDSYNGQRIPQAFTVQTEE